MRNPKRLAEVRKLPCIRCGNPHSQAAHSNFHEHGKGRGIKADDSYTVSLCHVCHSDFDQYRLGNREQSKELFEGWLVKVNRMLNQTDKDIF
ncbi:MAG TPA: hypothetical protein DHW80_06890 [Acinetobacter sp.]|uniref:DUF968 domain-containing protein n=1 Tax=Acinetobacter variabilis TaxID=70346 RepID=UPI000EBF8DC4|nr:hypothetical protein [Acinetobacter variabilis]HCL59494.1 hypothetical protein [Acinetobacter sp.]